MNTGASPAVDCRCILAKGIVRRDRRGALLWTGMQASAGIFHATIDGVRGLADPRFRDQ